MTASLWVPTDGCDAYCFWAVVAILIAALGVVGYLIYRASDLD